MTNRRWLAQSPARLERVLRHLAATYQVDAVQMHDMDFFISEARTAEFAARVTDLGLRWWALGRVDTLMQYSDATWDALATRYSRLEMMELVAVVGAYNMMAMLTRSFGIELEDEETFRNFTKIREYK